MNRIKKRTKGKILPLTILLAFTLIACGPSQLPYSFVWKRNFSTLGTSSSPRCADLNDDGILDIVIGAGMNETEASDSAVLAMDGLSGEVLWTSSASDQIVGSPLFCLINQDEIPDIIIGGRSANLFCIDGKSGNKIWSFEIPGKHPLSNHLKFNFFNGQLIRDIDHDGVNELLVSHGGNVKVPPHKTKGRIAGVLAIISGKNGNLIAADTMPDGKESYMAPIILPSPIDEESILFGSGGETEGGHLFISSLKDLIDGNLSNAKRLIKKEGHGFIAPPLVIDLNDDGQQDIVVNWHGGSILAVDGKTMDIMWENLFPDTEINNSITPGYFVEHGKLDLFSLISRGEWPYNTRMYQLTIDGKSGNILHKDSLGCTGFFTPASGDFDDDGLDEILLSVNEFSCENGYHGNSEHLLGIYQPLSGDFTNITGRIHAKNVATSPWVGDLDNNGRLDIIYAIQGNTAMISDYSGFRLARIATHWKKPILRWGAYMGHDGKNYYKK